MKRETGETGRTVARETLRRATAGTEPDMTRLLASVPELMAQARRRRAAALPAPLAARAWNAIPKLAAVTAAAVVLASLALILDDGSAAAGSASVDAVILDTEDGSSGDALLDALVVAEQNGG